MASSSNELVNFSVDEVSTVDKGANKKKFFLTKQEDNMADKATLEKQLEELNIEETDAIQKNIEELKKQEDMSSKGEAAVKAAMAILNSAKEDVPKNMSISMSNDDFSAHASIHKEDTEDADGDDKKVQKKEEVVEIQKKLDAEKAANAEIQKVNKELTDRVKKLEDENSLNKFMKKAEEEYPNLGETESIAKMLKNASETMSKEDYENLEKTLKASNEAQEKIFKELGSDMGSDLGDNEVKVQKMAEKIVESDPNITIEQARTQVREKHPELYE